MPPLTRTIPSGGSPRRIELQTKLLRINEDMKTLQKMLSKHSKKVRHIHKLHAHLVSLRTFWREELAREERNDHAIEDERN